MTWPGGDFLAEPVTGVVGCGGLNRPPRCAWGCVPAQEKAGCCWKRGHIHSESLHFVGSGGAFRVGPISRFEEPSVALLGWGGKV